LHLPVVKLFLWKNYRFLISNENVVLHIDKSLAVPPHKNI